MIKIKLNKKQLNHLKKYNFKTSYSIKKIKNSIDFIGGLSIDYNTSSNYICFKNKCDLKKFQKELSNLSLGYYNWL